MDNLSSHKRPAVRNAIRSVGAHLLFLPPYSPDLNPIEQVLAKLKHLMSKAAEQTHEATLRRIRYLLDNFPKHVCANYLKNSGYGADQCNHTLTLGCWQFIFDDLRRVPENLAQGKLQYASSFGQFSEQGKRCNL